mgnify:CR=1 FL=1
MSTFGNALAFYQFGCHAHFQTLAFRVRYAVKKALDDSIPTGYERDLVKKLSMLTDRMAAKVAELEQALVDMHEAQCACEEAVFIRDHVLIKMSELRVACDEAETLTAKKYWPFPTYGDLLFSVK